MSSSSSSPSSLRIHHQNGVFLVWNVDVMSHLRNEHRIIGNLIGPMPQYPRDTSQSGLPQVLMPEEVRLLTEVVEQGQIDLVESRLHFESSHTDSLKTHFDAEFVADINRKLREERSREVELNLDRIVAGRLRKVEGKVDDLEGFRANILEELRSKVDAKELPPEKITFKRFDTTSRLDSIRTFCPFQLPPLESNSIEALKYATFKHFWTLGYYLTEGQKFGGDFLAYDHLPAGFHAKFIIRCVHSNELDAFESNHLQAYGRLGKNVRKNIIVASFDSDSDSNSNRSNLRLRHIQWNPSV